MKECFSHTHLVLLAGVILTGCSSLGTSASGNPDPVKVLDKVDSYKCKFLGLVSGTYTVTWDEASHMVEGAMLDARSRASELKANTVVLQGSPQIIYNSESKQREADVTVNAYDCKP